MYFRHADEVWQDFPQLVPGVVHADGITADVSADEQVGRFTELARKRIEAGTEAELPEIRAWRMAFTKMGLKPTQYRCAAEALLRRLRKEGALPRLHPLIDLCNAMSLAAAVPIAVFDVAKVAGHLEVRRADGDETYLTFAGAEEVPAAQETIFADADRRAHARRWTNRQSGYSAVQPATRRVLIVAEALHESADADMRWLTATLADEIRALWSVTPTTAVLDRSAPQFDF